MANPEIAYEHSGSAPPTTLSAGIDSTALSMTLVDGSGYPLGTTLDFWLTLDPDTADFEKVRCSGRVGGIVTIVERGGDDTVARDHASGAVVHHGVTAAEATQFGTHVAAVAGVHGVTGAVVGTTDIQTVTNKSMSGTDNTFTAIPEASVTGLVANLAAEATARSTADGLRQLLSGKGAASGYASLDGSVKVPYAELPTGTAASTVAIGDHAHEVDNPTHTASLTSRNLTDADPGPKTMGTVAVTAGKWLLLASCKGVTLNSASKTRFEFAFSISGGTLYSAAVASSSDGTAIQGGGVVVGYCSVSGNETVSFTITKNGTGSQIDSSALGDILAIPLSSIG